MLKSTLGIILGLILSMIALRAQSLSAIGKAWAKNSVNAPVFRKNSAVSYKGYQYVSYYDSLGYVILAKRKLGTNTWQVQKTQYTGDVTDAHRSISMMIDGNGFLHLSWGHHNTALNYCKSTAAASLTLGNKSSMLGTLENDVTYPEFYKLPNGNLIFMYRYGVSGNGNLVINSYDLNTQKWTRLHDVLIDGQGLRNAYWQSCVDKTGTIHVSWVWRETSDVATNHDMCYAKSSDGGLTWYKSTGQKYTIPITLNTAETVKTIPQKSELINQTSMYADSYGRPYIASYWKEAGAVAPQYYMVYRDASGWKTKRMTDRKTNFSLSGSGTKKIPISRPQIVVDDRQARVVTYLVYRDEERDSRVSVNVNTDLSTDRWLVYDLSGFSVNSWEPSLDTELWRDSTKLHVFVQKMGQGDGETLEDLPAQTAYMASMPQNLQAIDTVDLNPIITEVMSDRAADDLYKMHAHQDQYTGDVWVQGAGPATLTIYDLQGKIVFLKEFASFPVSITKPLWKAGVYLVHAKGQDFNAYTKLILQY